MPKINVLRKKVIHAPVERVYDILSDMSQWKYWSPWLITDPKATVTDDKQSYSWKGNRVGEGNMQIVRTINNQSVDYDLEFLKPWKSKARIGMQVRSVHDGTEVTWSMDSSLPFFMFFMRKSMEGFIGMDYDRGLNLLKDYVEDGQVHSKLNFVGENQYPGCNYIGIRRSCTIVDMPKLMETDFTALMTEAADAPNCQMHASFCIYHKWDMKNGTMSYTAGIPYIDDKPVFKIDHIIGSIPATRVHTVEHIGPYEHLGNAWATQAIMQRNKEFKPSKKLHPFETYGNSPKDTAPKELVARIHFPVK